MKAGELRALLADIPEGQLVVMSKDAEGNSFSPLYEVEHPYWYEDRTRCVVLWPRD